MALALYEDALGVLQDHLPDWWAKTGTANLAILLTALAVPLDELSGELEDLHSDMALINATLTGLRDEYAFAYGVENEQLPPTVDALRAYIQTWESANGSKLSVIQTLTALLKTPVNTTGFQLTFPAGGSGFTFPTDGSGLTLFQQTDDTAFLAFAADGSGLTFKPPASPLVGQIYVADPADGTTPPGPPGPGLTFPVSGWVDVIESFTTYTWTVTTKSYLNFDRAAFARAVERLRQAHLLPATITELNT
jgi:hypothetical protein